MSYAILLLCSLHRVAVADLAQEGGMAVQLCDRIDQLYESAQLTVRGQAVAAVSLIPELYDRRDYALAWGQEQSMVELLEMIDASYQEGLDPSDYHQQTLLELFNDHQQGLLTPCERADFDILLTDALVRLGYHILFGKVDPRSLDADWNLARDTGGQDPVATLLSVIDSGSIRSRLSEMLPNAPIYLRMKRALAEYREIETRGGWPQVPPGPTLKPGMQSDRLLALRERLRIAGDIGAETSPDPLVYDAQLQQAVERFQRRHTLDPDGVIGPKTLEALNTAVSARIDQIRVNMERARWVFRQAPDEYLVADIAGFQVFYVRNGEVLWASPAQVGTPYRKTPVFQDTMSFIVFNPTWTVPPTILKKDILPKIRKDPGYLARKNMRVLDRRGIDVDPSSIDWSASASGGFPYMIRQDPGPDNALGRMKFMFPNKHMVYLHDTPYKSGFNSVERAFSSGCIRIEKPFELAELLLNDPDNWGKQQIERLVESKETRTVQLDKKIPVFLLYWTVDGNDQQFFFKPDVYNRDDAILKALNGGFRFDVPDNMPNWYRASDSTPVRG